MTPQELHAAAWLHIHHLAAALTLYDPAPATHLTAIARDGEIQLYPTPRVRHVAPKIITLPAAAAKHGLDTREIQTALTAIIIALTDGTLTPISRITVHGDLYETHWDTPQTHP